MKSKLEILVAALAAGIEVKIADHTLVIRNASVAPSHRISAAPEYKPMLLRQVTRRIGTEHEVTVHHASALSFNEIIDLAERMSDADVASTALMIDVNNHEAYRAAHEDTGLTPAQLTAAPTPAPQRVAVPAE
jgi:hypothetical protein